jgi:ribose transport system substrate-binding protein
MRRGVRGVVLVGACVLAASVATGCGSSSKSGSSTTAAKSGGTDYAAVVKKYLVPNPPDWQGPTSAPKPAAKKTIAVVSAAEVLEGAHRQVVGALAAAKVLGWDAYLCDGKGDPNQQNLCTQQAIQKGVDGIFWSGIDPSVVRQGADAAGKAGIPIVTGYNYGQASSKPPAGISKGVIADISSDQCAAGQALAAYMFANTKGKPKVAMINDPEFPIVQLRTKCTTQALKDGGADILSTTNIRGADVATKGPGLGSSIVQAKPKGTIDWIYAPYDAAALFISQGLTSTGRDDVKIVSFDANKANLDIIRKGGVEVADATSPLEWMGWAAMDEFNRFYHKAPVAQKYGLPVQILTKDNVDSPQSGADYAAEFTKIWGK